MKADNGQSEDIPVLPGTSYRVHDENRPQPPVVDPDPHPSDAVVLFDGQDLSGWQSKKDGGPPSWQVQDGYMEVVPGTGNIRTRESFGDCQLHLEWTAAAPAEGDGQWRGNSGVFLLGLYEVQVLDCYQNPTYPDGTTGAVYGQYPPLVNACRPPGNWQTYDIIWWGPRFSDQGELVRPAFMSVLHNGILVQYHRALLGPTRHKKVATYYPHAPVGPLELQDHRCVVRFRNIWYRPLDLAATAT